MPDDKLILYNDSLYYGKKPQQISPIKFQSATVTKSFTVDITNDSYGQKKQIYSDNTPIDINNIIYYTSSHGYELDITINRESAEATLSLQHMIYGDVYNVSTQYIDSNKHISSSVHLNSPILPHLRLTSNTFTKMTTGSDYQDDILSNINTLSIIYNSGGSTYIKYIIGTFTYSIYCLYIA